MSAAPDHLAFTADGSGSRVVLVHGFTQTARSWAAVAAGLVRDHRTVSVDLPGHGASSRVQADLWRTADFVAGAGGRATYVGYSLGARACLHLALRHQHLVERLVLLGATAGIDDPVERAARRDADEALARSIETDGVDAFLDRWLDQPLFAGLPASARTGQALVDRRTNTVEGLASSLRLCGTGTMDPPLWDRLAELRVPVLVLAGSFDPKFTALGHRLADGIGPNARFEAVPGAGHAAHLEQADGFTRVLRSWLDVSRSSGGDGDAQGQQAPEQELDLTGADQHGDQVGSEGALEHQQHGPLSQ